MPDDTTAHRARLALLIDADNIRAHSCPIIIREASALGTVTIKRVYGHFASSAMNAWQPLVHEYALSPVHIPPAAVGKNATDMKLAIEAMDLLHRGQLEGFCIASCGQRFHHAGQPHPGGRRFGLWIWRAEGLHGLCPFMRPLLLLRSSPAARTSRASKPSSRKQVKLPVDDIHGRDRGHVGRGGLGASWRGRADAQQAPMPDFDPRNYGFRKLSDLVESMKSVEVAAQQGQTAEIDGPGQAEVERKR